VTRRTIGLVAIAAIALCGGCEKTARNMYDQPRDKPLAQSPLWGDMRSARAPVDGTEPRSAGTRADTSSGRMGAIAAQPPDALAAAAPAAGDGRAGPHGAWTLAAIERGRERYDIFCAPCHSVSGDGDGMIVRRGFPRPPTFHSDRLREASDAHLYAVISDGYGAMYPYANRIASDDRRAIVAYIRALQLSQHAAVDDLPADARARLEARR